MCTAAPGIPVRSWLRAATADQHRDVDAFFADGLRTRVDYGIYLRGLHAVMSAVDAALVAAGLAAAWADWRPRAHAARLQDDLGAFGARGLVAEAPIAIRSHAAAAGALYVLEGSALGARLLVRDVDAMGVAPTASTFLRAVTGAGAALRWRTFLARLEASVAADARPADALAAARATFSLTARAFARARHDGITQ